MCWCIQTRRTNKKKKMKTATFFWLGLVLLHLAATNKKKRHAHFFGSLVLFAYGSNKPKKKKGKKSQTNKTKGRRKWRTITLFEFAYGQSKGCRPTWRKVKGVSERGKRVKNKETKHTVGFLSQLASHQQTSVEIVV